METEFGLDLVWTRFYLSLEGIEYIYEVLENEEKPYDLTITYKTIDGLRCVHMEYYAKDKKHFDEIIKQARER